MLPMKKETPNKWEYKVGKNATVANCVCICEKPEWQYFYFLCDNCGLTSDNSICHHISCFV